MISPLIFNVVIVHNSYLTEHPEALKAKGSANRTWLMGPEWPDRVARDVDTSSVIYVRYVCGIKCTVLQKNSNKLVSR